MINILRHRSMESELLDSPDINNQDLFKNLDELNVINKLLGGHQVTISGLNRLIKLNPQSLYTVLDVGCGGGDTAYQIWLWGQNNNIKIQILGIDILDDCIEYAQHHYGNKDLTFKKIDIFDVNEKFDFVTCNMVTHHLYSPYLEKFVKKMSETASISMIVNDLHRNIVAKMGIKFLTRIFSKSHLVKNDAPLSVAKGFKKNEWNQILHSANLSDYQVKWKWAFRHLISKKV